MIPSRKRRWNIADRGVRYKRTCLAFALLCVGGLIGEISNTGLRTTVPGHEAPDDARLLPRRVPHRFSLTSTLILNLAVALLCQGQALIDIVPARDPHSSRGRAQELAPVIVVARRSHDPLDGRNAPN